MEQNDDDYPQFDNLKIIKVLYTTKNSKIYLVRNSQNDNKFSVLKEIVKNKENAAKFPLIKREREFYESNAKIKNNNYPYYINAYKDDKNIYMEISFIEGLNLSELLLNDNLLKFNYKESNIILYKKLISQCISLVSDLHTNNYIYRDLKLNNMIIDKNLNIFLIDFGFVKHFDNQNCITKTYCGTLHMIAPEILLVREGKKENYNGIMTDIYSLGVLMYEIYFGGSPFGYKNKYNDEMEMIKKILNGLNDKENFGKEFYGDFKNKEEIKQIDLLKDLIKGCMDLNCDKRYNMTKIKGHKFFDGKFEQYAKKNKEVIVPNEKCHIKDIVDYISFNGEFVEDYEYSEKNKGMIDDIFKDF